MKSEGSQAPDPFDGLTLQARCGGVRLGVHVRPHASRPGIIGVRNGALALAVTALPADGAANADVVLLLATTLNVPRRDVELVIGPKSRDKVFDIAGITPDELRARLPRTVK